MTREEEIVCIRAIIDTYKICRDEKDTDYCSYNIPVDGEDVQALEKAIAVLEQPSLEKVLEEIKAEIKEWINEEYIPYTGGYMKYTIDPKKVLEIIDSHISGKEKE